MPLSGTLPYALGKPDYPSGNGNGQLLTSNAMMEIKSLMSQRGWRMDEAIAYVLRGAAPMGEGPVGQTSQGFGISPGTGFSGGADSIGPDARTVTP